MLRPRTKPSGRINRIDVTAFLSIMVVLFFTVLFADRGPLYLHHFVTQPVDLPHVSHAASLQHANREDAIHVAVERDGSFYFRNDRVAAEDLPARISAAVKQGSEKKVYLHADERSRYGSVKLALDAIRDAGIEDISFLANGR